MAGTAWYKVARLLLLGIILLASAWLRIAGHNWDEGQQINVDDTYVSKVALRKLRLPTDASLTSLFDPRRSTLNPRLDDEFFVYGALPIYVVKAVSIAAFSFTADPYFNGLLGIQQTGRIVTALFDTITALLVFVIGARLWGTWPGLAAAALYSLAVLPVHFSHFFITDPYMTTFMTATLLCSVLFYQTRRALFMLAAGLCVGLAMACKLSALPVIALPVVAALMRVYDSEVDGTRRVDWRGAVAWMGMVIAGAFLGLLVGDPFAVLDAGSYLGILSTQASIQSGAIDQWFTRKYVGTWPIAHLGGQLVLLGGGPLVGLTGVAGVGLVAARVRRKPRGVEGLLLIGACVYFAVISLPEIKWVRYLLPLIPYLCLFSIAFGLWAYEKAARSNPGLVARAAIPGLLLFFALLGAVAVSSIFTSEHTQIKASQWIYSNVPQGKRIGIETTALEMPLRLRGFDEQRKGYALVMMDPLADMPSPAASTNLRTQLREVDYLVLDATQAAETVPHLPWRYPVQIRYYDLLLSGRLGFSAALYATSYPRIGSLEIPDDGGWVDPSFMDSSHPPIWILRKERNLSDEEWDTLFAQAVQQPSVASRRKP